MKRFMQFDLPQILHHQGKQCLSIMKTVLTSQTPWGRDHVYRTARLDEWVRGRRLTASQFERWWLRCAATGPASRKSTLNTSSMANSSSLYSQTSSCFFAPNTWFGFNPWVLTPGPSSNPCWNLISWFHFCYYFWDLALGISPLASGSMVRSKVNPLWYFSGPFLGGLSRFTFCLLYVLHCTCVGEGSGAGGV